MERRRSNAKAVRRLSSLKGRNKSSSSLQEIPILPIPNFEFEDVLLSQLQVTDVISNCVLGENTSSWSLNDDGNISPTQKGKQHLLYHRCYNSTTLTPLWHAFASLDARCTGNALLGRLMSLSSTVSSQLGEEHHAESVIQKQFTDHSQVPFSKYKRYVLDTTTNKVIDSDRLCATCWLFCKHKYLKNNPLVDTLESVVPAELCDTLYYLFCVFNKLTEPGTYPPSMDYEETVWLLRKLLACLGMPWSSTHEESLFNEDFEKPEDFEPNPPLQVTFPQLLTVIAEVVGVDVARSHSFFRAVRRLCLTEYQEIIKSGWLNARKPESDVWKKRWGVLQGCTLICYDTVLCQGVKEEIFLCNNMHIESLPSTSSYKYRFRVVEKEGFNIISEQEFSCSLSSSSNSWITLINASIGVQKAGISAKSAEICERRLERYNRRESVRDVYRKKQDVVETYRRLQEAKKLRNEIEEHLQQRALQREAQMTYLERMDKIYERLEAIQLQRRLHNKEEREKRLIKLFNNSDQSENLSKVIENNWVNTTGNSLSLKDLAKEETRLEKELQDLKESPTVLASSIPQIQLTYSGNLDNNTRAAKRSKSLDPTYNFYSSLESMSTSSNDMNLLTPPDVTLH